MYLFHVIFVYALCTTVVAGHPHLTQIHIIATFVHINKKPVCCVTPGENDILKLPKPSPSDNRGETTTFYE